MEANIDDSEQFAISMIGRTVADIERAHILVTLRHSLGNRTHAANLLGISIRTLRNKLNEYASLGSPIPPARMTARSSPK